MRKLNEISHLDKKLQKLEHEINWNLDRSITIKDNIKRKIKKEYFKHKLFLLVRYSLLIVVGFVLGYSAFISQSEKLAGGNKILNAPAQNISEYQDLSEGNKIESIFPINAFEKIPTIVDKPDINIHNQTYLGKKWTIVHLFYPTSTLGRFISVHTSVNEEGSSDKKIENFIPKHPVQTYKATEIEIPGARAVLYEPRKDYGVYQLYIATDKYVYYLTNGGMFEEKQGNKEELIQLAKLIDFRNE